MYIAIQTTSASDISTHNFLMKRDIQYQETILFVFQNRKEHCNLRLWTDNNDNYFT